MTTRTTRPLRVAVAVAVSAMIGSGVTGCGSDESSATTTRLGATVSGADASVGPASDGQQPIVLRLGTNDPTASPTTFAMEEFRRQVGSLSDGKIEIELAFRAAGDPAPDDWEQAVAQLVIAGDLDLGLVSSSAWDTEGVMTLQALNAPFLIDSDALVGAVVSGDLAPRMLAGLDAVGVTGLALLPESLRHVFAFDEPLTSPSDFDGAVIRAPRSNVTTAVFEALGATADDPQGSAFDEAVADGQLAGAESSFVRATGLPGGGRSTATGNLTLFAKINTLVVNNGSLAQLTDEQRGVLRTAAANTLAAVVAGSRTDATDAQAFCDAGGSVVTAADADVAALETAVAPVYADLESDPDTAALLEAIRALKEQIPATTVDPCGGTTSEVASPEPTDGNAIPFGTYARTITTADGIGLDQNLVAEILGDDGEKPVELRIEDGTWTLYLVDDDEVGDLGTFTYDNDGHWVTESTSGGCSGCIVAFGWQLADDVLTLTLAEVPGASVYDDGVRLMTEGSYQAEPGGD